MKSIKDLIVDDFKENVASVKRGIKTFKEHTKAAIGGLEYVAAGVGTGLAIGTVLLIPLIGLNAGAYGVMGATEGVERLCGVKPKTFSSVKLVEKQVAQGSSQGKYNYGVFESEDGKRFTAYDTPVVTEFSFLPYNLERMEIGKKYDVKTFGWLVPSIVDTKETK